MLRAAPRRDDRARAEKKRKKKLRKRKEKAKREKKSTKKSTRQRLTRRARQPGPNNNAARLAKLEEKKPQA